MKIGEINNDLEQDKVDLAGTVKQIETPRAISTDYGQKSMAIAELEDDTGQIKLEVWGDKVNRIEEGDEVKVTEAYVKEFGGSLFINVSKQGSIKQV